MTHEQLFELHAQMCADALELMKRKNQDYRGGSRTDPFNNFKGSLVFGVEPEIGTMIRMNDKFQRVCAFLANGQLAVQSESIADIGLDLINYSVLLIGQLKDRASLESVEVGPEYTPPIPKKEWEELYMGKFDPIPPTVPIPEGYAMVTDGMTLMAGDLWMARNSVYGDKWVEIVAHDIGKSYDSVMFGSPVIRKYPTDPYRSTQIKIPAKECNRDGYTFTIPLGYRELLGNERVKENDEWLDHSVDQWVTVPKISPFTGLYGECRDRAKADGVEGFCIIRRTNGTN